MLMFRRRLARFASGWLVYQLCVLALAPTALCAKTSSGAGDVECTCSHGDGHVCPTHHTETKSKPKSCSCRGTTDSATAVIAGLFGPAAVLAVPMADTKPVANRQRPPQLKSR